MFAAWRWNEPGWESIARRVMPPWFVGTEIEAVALLMAVAVADWAVDMGRASRGAYAVAVLIGVVCGAAVGTALKVPLFHWVEATVYSMSTWLMFGGLATFVYVDRKRARATQARFRAAEIQRVKKAREVLESRLQAMQARVEPQFLFNTLAQVKRLYELDPPLAGRMLDDLIAYLRAAMPRMRDTSSTLAQEIELARAYLAIVKVRLGDRLEYAIDVPDGIGDARMPPMMLLPLIDHAVVHGLAPAQEAGTLIVTTEVAGGRLRIKLTDSGAGFVPEAGGDGMGDIRERLQALYGNDASLELERVEQRGTRAVMEIPYERIESSDR
jgi:sensor histidine kinase YesM